jgi:hypothetical protein
VYLYVYMVSKGNGFYVDIGDRGVHKHIYICLYVDFRDREEDFYTYVYF